jgi:hypothetical protein
VQGTLEEVLIDLCSELSEVMAEWVSRGFGGEIGWARIDERVANQLDSPEDVRQATSLLTLILSNPADAEIPYLYRLLAATFLANAVRLDPVAAAQLRASLSLYELYLDANVLLPLLVEEHPNHLATVSVVEESRRAGVQLLALRPIFNEVRAHRELARRDLRELGGHIEHVAAMVTALGGRANVFLQGYVASASPEAEASWQEYLARYSDTEIADALRRAGIDIREPHSGSTEGDLFVEALTAIRNAWLRKLGYDREEVLNVNEAIQVCHIYFRRQALGGSGSHIWFLSNETVLQHVFERQPSRWMLPATFPYSAWVAFLDSRMPHSATDPRAVVRAILRGQTTAFDLPTPVALVRQRAFGDRVTTRDEEEALDFALSDFSLMRRVERAQRAVQRRGRSLEMTSEFRAASQAAVADISAAIGSHLERLRNALTLKNEELASARRTIEELEADRGSRFAARAPRGRAKKRKKG